MRIYEGSPREDFEEVFRSIGAFIDQRGMKEVLLAEAPDGFIVQGLVAILSNSASEFQGSLVKETLTFLDDDIARFMEEAISRRGQGEPAPDAGEASYYETAFRVLGRYMDEQRPRDVFFFEQEGSFVLRLLPTGSGGNRHILAEFTSEDIADMIARAPTLRYPPAKSGATSAAGR
ncbi:MAG: hypothetical protein E6J17_10330 [Chloroflexi bacterium]|nr:MAG: hypothetical protein E6J17_10330 [Chloroflexota bacterium]